VPSLRTQRILALSLAAAAPLTLVACSGDDDPIRRPGASSSHARVRVVVEVDAEARVRVLGDLRVLRYRDIDVETAEILAGTEPRTGLEMERCALADADERLDRALASLPERVVLHYLDAGEVLVQAAGGAASLAPRERPALAPFVSGAEYGAIALDEGLLLDGPDRAEVSVTGFGGEEVGPFDVSASLPPPPGDLTVSAASVEPGDLEIGWAASADPRGVLVSVRAGWRELRCLTADDGRLRLSPDLLARLPGDASLVIGVERWRRTGLSAPGLDGGELEVAARAVVAVSAP
jgi:hypothetical protein